MRFYRSKFSTPPQGSGHFLVGVVDYLAEELITNPDAPFMTETASEETETRLLAAARCGVVRLRR